MYEDAIIPEANAWMQILNTGFGLTDKGLELYADFSHVPALQEDLNTKSKMYLSYITALDKAISNQSMTTDEARVIYEQIGLL